MHKDLVCTALLIAIRCVNNCILIRIFQWKLTIYVNNWSWGVIRSANCVKTCIDNSFYCEQVSKTLKCTVVQMLKIMLYQMSLCYGTCNCQFSYLLKNFATSAAQNDSHSTRLTVSSLWEEISLQEFSSQSCEKRSWFGGFLLFPMWPEIQLQE